MNEVFSVSSSSLATFAKPLCELCGKHPIIKTDVRAGRVVNVCRRCADGRVEPIRRQSKKIGRNDLCRCGSGKKFKKCCGKQKRNNNAE